MAIETIVVTDSAACTSRGFGRNLARLSDGTLAAAFTTIVAGDMAIAVALGAGDGTPWVVQVVEHVVGSDLYCGGLAVDSNDNLYCCWEDWTLGGAQWAMKPLGGAWTAAADIPPADPTNYNSPAVAVDDADNAIFAFCADMAAPLPQRGQVCCRIRSAAGVWGAQEQVTEGAGAHHVYPQVAIDTQSGAHFLSHATGYGAFPARYQLIYRCRTAAGAYEAQIQITDDNSSKLEHGICIDDATDDIHITYNHGGNTYWITKALADLVFGGPTDIDGGLNLWGVRFSRDRAGNMFCVCYDAAGAMWTVRYQAGAWDAPIAFEGAAAADNSLPNPLWAMFPEIAGARTNLPETGVAVVYSYDIAAEEAHYGHFVLSWPAIAPTITAVTPSSGERGTP